MKRPSITNKHISKFFYIIILNTSHHGSGNTEKEKINEISNEKLFKDITTEPTNFKIPMDANGDRKRTQFL